jgi:two-component system, NtrC family, sensor kinase
LSPIPWWNRLAFRLTAAVAVTTLAVVGTAAYLYLQVQQRQIVAEVVRGVALVSETVKSATYHDMLADRRPSAYQSMQAVSQQAGIDRVRVFNKEGRVTFSTDSRETGTLVDKNAEACYLCHDAGRPLERLTRDERHRIYTVGDHRVLAMVTPIYNESACSSAACHAHPAGKRVLGVIDVGISLKEIDQDVALVARQSVVASLVSVACVGLFVVLLTQQTVVGPVRRLLVATRKLSAGDFAQEVHVSSSGAGEVAALEASFNEMIAILGAARADRLQLLRTLEQQVEDRTAALKRAQDQLVQTEKLSSLGRLAASVAHEINNPLAGILTYSKLMVRLLDADPVDESTRLSCVGHLKLVQRETERCTAIVRNLLEFARQRPLALTDVDATAVLDEALSLISHQAKLQGVVIEREVVPLPHLRADFGQLRQAFVNIILNACEAMASGGTIRISAKPAGTGDTVELSFADTGPGIPADTLARVFDPFFTTKDKGTGLGLSVVYGIVEGHGGTVTVTSDVGRGTTFVMRLPVSGGGSTMERAHVDVLQERFGRKEGHDE